MTNKNVPGLDKKKRYHLRNCVSRKDIGEKASILFLIFKCLKHSCKKEDLLSNEFLKQFKTGDDLNNFLSELEKRGVEQILEGELDAYLNYGEQQKSDTPNYRNGHTSKQIKTVFGESEIKVPRDRDSSFNAMLVPKRKSYGRWNRKYPYMPEV